MLLPLCAAGLLRAALPKPPWRMVNSNDLTHIVSCMSPYNTVLSYEHPCSPDNVLTDDMIRASVDEMAVKGMDAQFLQPGYCWIAWWPSRIAPVKDADSWFEGHYGKPVNNIYHNYLKNGGDIISVFIDQCRRRNQAAVISFRLNDSHHLPYADDPEGYQGLTINRFYVEHPQYRLGTKKTRDDAVFNWLIPEVRDYKFSLIEELCQQYDIDGLELDFMRHARYFPDDTPPQERLRIMEDFIKRVRALLDRTQRGDKYRWLGARIPLDDKLWKNLGIDLKRWNRAGISFFNLSSGYCFTQQNSVAKARAQVPDAAIYLELTHTPQTWNWGGIGFDSFSHRRGTREMFASTAALAGRRGADGISWFNFVYYREYGAQIKERGPYYEPPFDYMTDAVAALRQKQNPDYFYRLIPRSTISRQGDVRRFTMDMVPPPDGRTMTLRLQVVSNDERNTPALTYLNIDRGDWEVRFNGEILAPEKNTDPVYPFATPFKVGFGDVRQYLAWDLPASLVRDGQNQVELRLLRAPANGPLRMHWIEAYAKPAPAKHPKFGFVRGPRIRND